MKTVSINVVNHCVPCENHCRYCLLSWCGKLSGLDYARSEDYARRFHDWLKEHRPELSFLFYFGYSMEHPKLSDAIRFMQSIGSVSGEFLQFDGMKFRTAAETREFLTMLKANGIRLIDLTFYGTRDYHDRFAGRRGDYDFIMLVLKTANEIGLDVDVGLPVTHENAPQIDDFLRETDAYRIHRLFLFVPHEEGRGVTLAPIRFTKADYDAMSEQAKAHFDRTRFRTEGEWIRNGVFSTPTRRILLLSLTAKNIDFFEKLGFAETISYLEDLDARYYEVIPPLETLAHRYGDPDGDAFYSERDLYLHYQRRYIEENDIEIYDINDERQCGSRRV